jgi:hypothetical protein
MFKFINLSLSGIRWKTTNYSSPKYLGPHLSRADQAQIIFVKERLDQGASLTCMNLVVQELSCPCSVWNYAQASVATQLGQILPQTSEVALSDLSKSEGTNLHLLNVVFYNAQALSGWVCFLAREHHKKLTSMIPKKMKMTCINFVPALCYVKIGMQICALAALESSFENVTGFCKHSLWPRRLQNHITTSLYSSNYNWVIWHGFSLMQIAYALHYGLQQVSYWSDYCQDLVSQNHSMSWLRPLSLSEWMKNYAWSE